MRDRKAELYGRILTGGKNHDSELCWQILPEVSRSFSLCIKMLPKPLNEQMMLSYLIFRILDTIEDSQAPLETKKELFDSFLSLMRAKRANPAPFKSSLCSKLNYTYEQSLLENADSVLRLYRSQPPQVRTAIRKRARTMARGMYEFQRRGIETFADQNRYSYYVAGVIGYLFNDLLYYNRIISARLKEKLKKYAMHFGLALQKVNILRDIAHDIAEDRHFWPTLLMKKYGLSYESICSEQNREAALRVLHVQIRNARKYLVSAMNYILLLPKKALRVRIVCLIPLFMAIESYVKCMNNLDVFDRSKTVKINRLQVEEIVAKSSLWGGSNDRLVRWFLKSMSANPELYQEYANLLYFRAERRSLS